MAVEIEGLPEVLALFGSLRARAADASPLTSDWATGAAGEVRNNLVAERTPDGRMQPLSERYAARKAKRYPGKTILRATDIMLGSISQESGPRFAEAGPEDPKARYHASHEPRTKMPLRDFVFISGDAADGMADALADYIVEGL